MKKTCLGKFTWTLIVSLSLFCAQPGYSLDEDIAKYPSRPVTFIHPFAAGTAIDVAIRLINEEVGKILGQPFVVVNKAGGSGSMGVAAIATAKPDGYTLGNVPAGTAFMVPLLEKVPYDTVRDLKMIAQFAAFNPGVFVRSDSPFKSFKDIINYARRNPKKLTHGTAGAKGIQYVIMKQIEMKENVEFTLIPFASASQTETALLGNHIMIGSGDFNYSLLEAGEIRVLALWREERSAEYPNIPILKDLGYDVRAPYYACVAGPKKVPQGIVNKLEDAFAKASKKPAFIEGMKGIHMPVVYRGSKEMEDYVAINYKVYEKLFKDIGLTK